MPNDIARANARFTSGNASSIVSANPRGQRSNGSQQEQIRAEKLRCRGYQRNQWGLVDVAPVRALTADDEIQLVAVVAIFAIRPQMQRGCEKSEPYGRTGPQNAHLI